MLAEVSTKAISQARQPDTFSESKQIAREGGTIAGDARENIEKRVGGTVISALNAKDKPALDTGAQTPEILNNQSRWFRGPQGRGRHQPPCRSCRAMRDAEAPGFCKRSAAGSGIPPERGMSRSDRGLEVESPHPEHKKAQSIKTGRNFVRMGGLHF